MSNPIPAATQFNRYEYGPSFQLAALLSSSFDLIRPQRVTDLTVLSYDVSSRIAELGWTAPRDNYGSGDIGSFSYFFKSPIFLKFLEQFLRL